MSSHAVSSNILHIMYSYVFVAVILGIIGITIAVPALLPEPGENEVSTYDFPFVNRYQWGARQPKEKTILQTPVPYVVIHHSYKPAACYDAVQCKKAMQSMQNFHMDDRGWWDIGYNFAVGSDGTVYEGRGWTVLGAHSLHFNTISLGICLIGDWTTSLPPSQQIKTAKALIAAGVELGYIKTNYKLVGHRQVRDTECPGDVLYNNVKSWEHHVSFPATYLDLVQVRELPKEIKDKLIHGNSTHIEA
ncbi:PREDICTED: peptidoglycan-recognition protein LB-like isoform X1 [Papilio xuthus]|uniref:Peptidoglycan recognition protein n=2 Tax=Papilio xuthus TaxID=66420 RepID=A0AAJ7E8Y9_PAPXU|nr:PREDICTED: peptidoglycan-recognition protein LB-like isoform X1 [Papilio xuthus]